MTLAQDATGSITGAGWVMTADVPPQQDLPVLIVAGTVTEDGAVSMTIADAADTSAFFTITGSIADDGSMAGTCPESGRLDLVVVRRRGPTGWKRRCLDPAVTREQ